MKIADTLKAYKDFSTKASDTTRALALAGIAVVWVFRVKRADAPTNIFLDSELVLPATLFVLALALDVFQYVYAAAAWGIFHRVLEHNKISQDKEFMAPATINWPTLFFFWVKLITVVAAYILLILNLVRRLQAL